jgi:type IV secretory pathway TrbD component
MVSGCPGLLAAILFSLSVWLAVFGVGIEVVPPLALAAFALLFRLPR